MARRKKPKIEYRIVCSGKGKPWHVQGQNRQHTHAKKALDQAQTDAEWYNTETPVELLHPLARECRPWTIEQREIGAWEPTSVDHE